MFSRPASRKRKCISQSEGLSTSAYWSMLPKRHRPTAVQFKDLCFDMIGCVFEYLDFADASNAQVNRFTSLVYRTESPDRFNFTINERSNPLPVKSGLDMDFLQSFDVANLERVCVQVCDMYPFFYEIKVGDMYHGQAGLQVRSLVGKAIVNRGLSFLVYPILDVARQLEVPVGNLFIWLDDLLFKAIELNQLDVVSEIIKENSSITGKFYFIVLFLLCTYTLYTFIQ
jgi:hypothetical protein